MIKYVKVIKCSKHIWWYNDFIGKIFKVDGISSDREDYLVKDEAHLRLGLTIIDCEDSTEEEYLYQETGVRPVDTTTSKEDLSYLVEFLHKNNIT